MDQIRTQWAAGEAARDAGLDAHPADVARVDDIAYGATDPTWQRLDVYRPRAAGDSVLPVIVSVHGGGWIWGSKENYQYYCLDLARRGFAVVNFSYRLAPKWQFPTTVEDTNLAFAWVMAHAAEHGLDTTRLFAVGDSAGGHLLALYAALTTNPELAERLVLSDGKPVRIPKGVRLRAVALNSGEYKVLFDQRDSDLARPLMAAYLPEDGSTEELALMDVTTHVTSDFPPTYLMTATGDFLMEQAPYMATALLDARVPFTFRMYGDATHRLPHIFHCNVRTPEAAECNDDECAFFKRWA